jgi:hypothetical protein
MAIHPANVLEFAGGASLLAFLQHNDALFSSLVIGFILPFDAAQVAASEPPHISIELKRCT